LICWQLWFRTRGSPALGSAEDGDSEASEPILVITAAAMYKGGEMIADRRIANDAIAPKADTRWYFGNRQD
jgi:hypothetical protein